MSWQHEALKRLDALIEAGQKLKNDGTYESTSLMTDWMTQAKSALHSILGRDHTYSRESESNIDWRKGWRPLVEILNALRSDTANGYLRTTANIISAEIFTDFLHMAQHLLEHEYKDPAASLCGAVLEDGLRRIARNNDITVTDNDDLNSLRDKCARKGVFNNLVRQQILSWTTLRNAADHGKFHEYDAPQVHLMIEGVRSFLGNHLG